MEINKILEQVNLWHWNAFPWAKATDCARKLDAEAKELIYVLNCTMPSEEKRQAAGEEAADVLITLLAICGRWGIDLEKAFAEKFEKVKAKYTSRLTGNPQ